MKVECLGELERLAQHDLVDLYYADESRVCPQPCVPYAWQFKDEQVFMPSAKGIGLNCFALINRANNCHFATTKSHVDGTFIVEQLDRLSFSIERVTVVVLDNAPVHSARKIQERRPFWQERGLYLFFLPPYSPHLNIAETLWRKLKYEWLQPKDYVTPDTLFYRVQLALAAVGTGLKIQFSEFNIGLI